MLKRTDPAELFGEKHYRVPEIAERWSMSQAAVRNLFQGHPRIRYLPKRSERSKRAYRTMLIPESVMKEKYLEMFKP